MTSALPALHSIESPEHADATGDPLPLHRDPFVADAAAGALDELRTALPSLLGAMLLTDDGFEIARTPAAAREATAASASGNRLASLASSMQALTEAISRELTLGDARLSLIDTEHGRVLFRRVPERPIVLAAMMRDDATLGQGISSTARAVKTLGIALGPVSSA